MKKIFLIFSLVILYSLTCFGQQCGNCKQTFSLANYDLDVQVAQPELQGEKTQGWLEWLQLFWVGKHASNTLFQNNKNCIRFTQPLDTRISSESFETKDGIEVPPLIEESELIKVGQTYTNLPPGGDLSRFGNYITTGYVKKSGDGYVLHMEIQAACNRKTVASADVPFQPSSSSQNAINIGQQAAAQLSPLIEKIKQFEIRERQNDQKVALDGGLEDAIIIKPKKRNLASGEQTEIEISFKDCDGQPLAQREIVFTRGTLNGTPISAGTTGGTVTPATVMTDGNGNAKVFFKMGSAKTAIINAYHIYSNPVGCENVKLGSTPIGGIPVQVQVSYEQNETRTVKRGTLPGVDVEGGDEAERTHMRHTSILYHYPSPDAVKKGFLVEAALENGEPDSKTVYVLESGRYDWSKNVQPANVFGMVGNQRVVMDTEEGSQTKFSGTASLQHPSEILFHLGNTNDSASFMWNIQYPASSGEDIAGGGASIIKGEEGVQWIVNKISDPNIPYKTEYLLKLTLDAAEEFRKGNKAMKDLFGMDLDDMSNTIDPTKKHQNMAGASGFQTITVRILSPYGSK